MMNKKNIVCIVFPVVLAFSGSVFGTIHTFDDFSSLTTDPEISGYLADGGFEAAFSGDDGGCFSDPANGSLNALILGDRVAHRSTAQLMVSFNLPVTELVMEFDAMQLCQGDTVTASTGTWTNFAATLSLSGQTLIAMADPVSPGGSGIDDDLLATLTFATPVNSVTFTNVGAFAMDAFTANAIPEPMTVSLLGLGGLTLLRRRRHG
ncbi:MAG: PEP-CTERM sorting domain-containing protein [Planctomycetota bacterium]|jgi:hypothetical protein